MKLSLVEQMRAERHADGPLAIDEAIRSHPAAQLLEDFGRQSFVCREQVVVFSDGPVSQGLPDWFARFQEKFTAASLDSAVSDTQELTDECRSVTWDMRDARRSVSCLIQALNIDRK